MSLAISPPPSGIRPQRGPQEAFLSTSADIAIYGGAAGGGKSFGLLMESIRHVNNPGFGAVIFRRMSTQITSEGGLWDTAKDIYTNINGAEPGYQPRHHWKFPTGSKVSFAHLQYENDVLGWQGSQIPLIGFDELTHFTEGQFFYMLSRNRSTCGVRPYVRATTNPDVDSWVAKFIAWWIGDDGYPILSRSGVIRYFSRVGDRMVWGSSKLEVAELSGIAPDDAEIYVKSVTFIPSKLEDNQILMKADPSYKANLMALGRVERERLLGGNWKVRKQAGDTFPSTKVNIIPAIPSGIVCWVRRWDLAATKVSEASPDPDSTASVLMGLATDGRIIIAEGINVREDSSEVRKLIKATAIRDKSRFGYVKIVLPIDPGQAGKDQVRSLILMLRGFSVSGVREKETGSKEVRAQLLASQWQVGNVDIVEGRWNDAFVSEMDGFPHLKHDDWVDAASGAFIELDAKASIHQRFALLAD